MISANGQETLVWRGGFRRWLAALGPTAMLATMSMGAGTIGSNIAAGATMGYQIAWLIVLAIAWKVVMLYLIGKTTCITQLSVLEQYAKYFHKSIAFVAGGLMLLTIYPVMAFTGAVLGHALVFLVPALSPFAAIVICFFVIGYVYVLRGGFKWISMLCAAFVAFMTLMFVVNAWIVGMDVDSLWQGLVVPSLPAGKDGTILFVGLLGSTISIVTILFAGYSVKNAGWTLKDIPVMTWDICVFSGVFFCVFSLGIFISGTALLGQPISEPVEVAAALEPVAGPLAKWVFALGYFTAVFTTVAAGCYLPGYILNDFFKWKLNGDLHKDNRFKLVSIVSLGSILLAPLVSHLFPTIMLIVFANALFILSTPFVILFSLILGLRRDVMGEHRIGWPVAVLVAGLLGFSSWSVYVFVARVMVTLV